MLEHLHFSTADEDHPSEGDMAIRVGHWTLPHLKTLVYRCSFPVKGKKYCFFEKYHVIKIYFPL